MNSPEEDADMIITALIQSVMKITDNLDFLLLPNDKGCRDMVSHLRRHPVQDRLGYQVADWRLNACSL